MLSFFFFFTEEEYAEGMMSAEGFGRAEDDCNETVDIHELRPKHSEVE